MMTQDHIRPILAQGGFRKIFLFNWFVVSGHALSGLLNLDALSPQE